MILKIFTDISVCQIYKIGTYAILIQEVGAIKNHEFVGKFKEEILDTCMAETLAIMNAFHIAKKLYKDEIQGFSSDRKAITKVVFYTDNLNVAEFLSEYKTKSKVQFDFLFELEFLAITNQISYSFEYVKGKQDTNNSIFIHNNWCHNAAINELRIQRQKIKNERKSIRA